MDVALPALAGRYGLEWLVQEGDVVTEGQVLAWLAVVDHCALLPLKAPVAGRVTARWTQLLTAGPAGAIVADIDGGGERCRAAERDALRAERAHRLERLAALDARRTTPMAATLVGPEARELESWLAAADARLA
jgi:pyruvate/2-oxoglutarate dehydrogenase complex dihydrolipoamide acyltransferase (E2) component